MWVTEYWCKDQKIQILYTNINFFFGKARQTLKLSESSIPIMNLSVNFFEVSQKARSNLLIDWILLPGSSLSNFLDKCKTIFFLCKIRQTLKLSEMFTHILELPIKLKSNFKSDWLLVQGSKIPNLFDKYKVVFWEESEANLQTFSRRIFPNLS